MGVVRRVVLVAVVVVGLCQGSPGLAESGTSDVRAAATPAVSRCGAVLSFVGLTLDQARALAKHCGQRLGYVLRVPSRAAQGTVISQSQPYMGNDVVVSTGPLTNNRTVLRDAPAPPVSTECTATIVLSLNGNATPLTCYGPHVNVEAWDFYAALRPTVMRLPRNASVCQVAAAVIDRHLTAPEMYSAFRLSKIYNGWEVPDGLGRHLIWGVPYHGISCAHG